MGGPWLRTAATIPRENPRDRERGKKRNLVWEREKSEILGGPRERRSWEGRFWEGRSWGGSSGNQEPNRTQKKGPPKLFHFELFFVVDIEFLDPVQRIPRQGPKKQQRKRKHQQAEATQPTPTAKHTRKTQQHHSNTTAYHHHRTAPPHSTTAPHRTAQHRTAQHSAQHSTAHSTAQHTAKHTPHSACNLHSGGAILFFAQDSAFPETYIRWPHKPPSEALTCNRKPLAEGKVGG